MLNSLQLTIGHRMGLMKYYFCYIFFCILVFSSCKQEPQTEIVGVKPSMIAQLDTNQHTRILWKDSVLNFGMVNEGDTVRLQFDFKNAGNKLLFITDVRAGCGCTIADYPEKPISPDEKGFITAVFTTASHPGTHRKNILVRANTKGGFNHKLFFIGDVKPGAGNKKS